MGTADADCWPSKRVEAGLIAKLSSDSFLKYGNSTCLNSSQTSSIPSRLQKRATFVSAQVKLSLSWSRRKGRKKIGEA